MLNLHEPAERLPLGNWAIATPAMPSDPYQSQVFRKLLRQTRHWLDRRQQTIRQLQVAASWSTQILVYPVYALFQSARFVKQSLRESLGQAIQPDLSLLSDDRLDKIEIPLQSSSPPITGETALQQVFQTVESFSLPERLPIGLEPQTRVRAIACLVETQTLVLVTQFNQILDVLNPQQQHELAQRISWEMAASGRLRRPKRLFDRVIGALQGARRLLDMRPAATYALPASDSVSLAVDAPVRQSMLAVRDYLTEIDLSSHLPSLKVDPNPSALSSIFIRGVATQLEARSLVLVTNRNEILDILNADQQLILQQRIIWEVAHYCRYLRLRYAAAQLDVVRSPSAKSPVFPGVRPFYQLMAWMQQGSVAIATNLFKEADLADTSPQLLPSAPQINFTQLYDSRKDAPTLREAEATETLRERFTNRITVALISVIRRPQRSLNPELTTTLPNATQVISEKPDQRILKRERSPDIAASLDNPLPEIIDTEVTLVGYEPSLLEQIMRLLDLCFLWIEEFVRLLWNGLLKLVPKR